MKIKCPACSKLLSIPDSAAGKVVKCPCGKQLRAPGGAGSAKPAAAKPSAPNKPAAGGNRAAGPAKGGPRPAGGGNDFDPEMFDELTDGDLKPIKAVSHVSPKPAAPSGGGNLLNQYSPQGGSGGGAPLASVGKRIGGKLIDVFFIGVFNIAGSIAGGMAAGPIVENAITSEQMLTYIGVAAGIGLIPHIVLAIMISLSGQSIGKKLLGTRIVIKSTGETAGFVNGWLLRDFVFGLLLAIPLIGLIILLVDVIYLFHADHETLHDKLASTQVVVA